MSGQPGSPACACCADLAEALWFIVAVHEEKMGSSLHDALVEARRALVKARAKGVRIRGL